MRDDLTRYLDGELGMSELEGDIQKEARAWDRLLTAFQVTAPPGGAPPWLEDRVMAEIEALPEPSLFGRAWGWMVNPKPVRIAPLWAGLAAAALAVVLLVPSGSTTPTGTAEGAGGVPATTAAADGEPMVYVQFVLDAPGAASVVVAGDFDGWEGTHALTDPDGDGTWSGRVPVRPGVHAYMFLVNGSDWVTDPRAERYADDGFGNQNAVLAVAAPVT